jgi:DNA primase
MQDKDPQGGRGHPRAVKLGLYRESGREHFNGSLVVPMIDETDKIHEIYGHKIRSDLRSGTPSHL